MDNLWFILMMLVTIYAVADIISKARAGKRKRDDDDDLPPTGGVIA